MYIHIYDIQCCHRVHIFFAVHKSLFARRHRRLTCRCFFNDPLRWHHQNTPFPNRQQWVGFRSYFFDDDQKSVSGQHSPILGVFQIRTIKIILFQKPTSPTNKNQHAFQKDRTKIWRAGITGRKQLADTPNTPRPMACSLNRFWRSTSNSWSFEASFGSFDVSRVTVWLCCVFFVWGVGERLFSQQQKKVYGLPKNQV